MVWYRQKVFLPAWAELDYRLRTWTEDNQEKINEALESGRTMVVWFHDESTFYANDRWVVRWVHKNEKVVPRTKGEGPSLMAADFVLTDYSWLTSVNGNDSTHILFKAGKNCEGYFTSEDIIKHVSHAMDILDRDYSDEDHVLVFDNAPTHLKHEDGAPSARKMPKFTLKEGKNWGVEVNQKDLQGGPVYGPNGKTPKMCIGMGNAWFKDGTPQDLYWPPDHPRGGIFKEMAVILEERGFAHASTKLLAQCKDFKCTHNLP